MIPRIGTGGFLTVDAAERRIDDAILAMQAGRTSVVCLNLSPIAAETVETLRIMYETGGWKVVAWPVNMAHLPHGYQFRVRDE